MRAYIVEFVGTLFLGLVAALTGNAIAIGAVLIALVYIGGHISGAHYNPAITLAMYLRGKINRPRAIRYVAVQLAAGFVAAALFYVIKGMWFLPKPGESVSIYAAALVELLFTFLLAYTVLQVAASAKTKGNSYFGLAIGLSLMAGAFAGGPISGGVFNPAIGVGALLFDIANWSANIRWMALYIIGPLAGAGLAAMVFGVVEENA